MKKFLILRLLLFINAIVVTYTFTGNFLEAGKMTITLIILNTLTMYLVMQQNVT